MVLFEIKGKIALHAGFFAAAQIFHGKIEVLDLQMNAPGVHIAHFALAHHQAHQFHGQLIGRRDGSGLGAGNGGSGGSGRRRILSGHGLALAHFQHGIVQAHLAHHQVAGEQRGQFQLHHAAFDGHGKALAVLDLAPTGLPEFHAGRQQGQARRAGEDQRFAGGLGRGVSDLIDHELRVDAAEQDGPGHAQHDHDAQNPE